MARPVAFRHASRLLAASVGPCTCISAAAFLRPAAVRLDSVAIPVAPRSQAPRSGISTKAVRQISSGSLAGLLIPVAIQTELAALEAINATHDARGTETDLIHHLPSGFGTGLVVAIFSRTLVFLGSFLAVSIYVSVQYPNCPINSRYPRF